MTAGDLIVGALIIAMIAGAVATLIHNRRKGKNNCGCNCSGCPRKPSMVTIDEGDSCDHCKKE